MHSILDIIVEFILVALPSTLHTLYWINWPSVKEATPEKDSKVYTVPAEETSLIANWATTPLLGNEVGAEEAELEKQSNCSSTPPEEGFTTEISNLAPLVKSDYAVSAVKIFIFLIFPLNGAIANALSVLLLALAEVEELSNNGLIYISEEAHLVW